MGTERMKAKQGEGVLSSCLPNKKAEQVGNSESGWPLEKYVYYRANFRFAGVLEVSGGAQLALILMSCFCR